MCARHWVRRRWHGKLRACIGGTAQRENDPLEEAWEIGAQCIAVSIKDKPKPVDNSAIQEESMY